MRSLLLTTLLIVAVPSASAEECVTQQKDLCKMATDAGMDRLFGDYADIGFAGLGLFVAVLVLVLLVALLRRGRERPKVSLNPRDLVREVGPGGSVQLIFDVENRRKRTSTDIAVDWGKLPAGWSGLSFVAVPTPSGYTMSYALSDDDTVHLSSARRGAHRAAVALQLTAPNQVAAEETLDLPVRVTPVARGRLHTRRSHRLHYTVLLTSRRPLVQITSVTHQPEAIVAGQQVLTKAQVSNGGEVEARDVTVALILNDKTVDQRVLPVLGAHQEAIVEFQWTPSAGENRLRINVA